MADTSDHSKKQPSNAGKTFPPEILSSIEVRALMGACSKRAPTGIRNRALIALLYRGGLRISEALALKPRDLDQETGAVRVRSGKGRTYRTVGLDSEAFAILERWSDRRTGLGITGHSPVFCTLKGGPISTAYVRALFPRLGRKAGIEKRVHAHGLRHTHAAELAAEKVPINIIQAQLGHRNVAVTSRYLAHIAPIEVIETMKRRAWAA